MATGFALGRGARDETQRTGRPRELDSGRSPQSADKWATRCRSFSGAWDSCMGVSDVWPTRSSSKVRGARQRSGSRNEFLIGWMRWFVDAAGWLALGGCRASVLGCAATAGHRVGEGRSVECCQLRMFASVFGIRGSLWMRLGRWDLEHLRCRVTPYGYLAAALACHSWHATRRRGTRCTLPYAQELTTASSGIPTV